MSHKDAIAKFVACLFERDDLVEIRRLPSTKSTVHWADFVPRHAECFAQENVAATDIFFGANPRRNFRGRTDADVQLARCLLADFDRTDVRAVVETIADAGLPAPTVVVNSGHGVHTYWRLTEPLTDLNEWRRLQKGIAHLLGSDPKVCNPSRIMRLPGFLNHKEPAATCTLVEADPKRRYLLAQLATSIPDQPDTAANDLDTMAAVETVGLDVIARAANTTTPRRLKNT